MEIHFQTCQDVMLVQRRAHKLVMLFQNWNPDVNYSKTNTEFIKTTKLVKVHSIKSYHVQWKPSELRVYLSEVLTRLIVKWGTASTNDLPLWDIEGRTLHDVTAEGCHCGQKYAIECYCINTRPCDSHIWPFLSAVCDK